MKQLLFTFCMLFSLGLSGQNASFGMGVNSFNLDGEAGLSFTSNVRAQLTKRFGWQTEVGYLSPNEKITTRVFEQVSDNRTITTTKEGRSTAMSIKTGITAKLFTLGGVSGEAIIGGGLYKNEVDIYGLLSGEFFLSAQISKNVIVGIPLSYNFITWVRDDYYTAGVSIRFFM